MGEQVLVQLTNLSKTFPGVKALDKVQLTIKEGHVHALVGENGAGKSTLIKVLAGVHQPDQGAVIKISGEEVRLSNPMDAMEKGISVIYQDISLFPNLTVAENIAIGNKSVWKQKLNWRAIKAKAEKALKDVGATIDLDTKLGDLSIASQQIVAIARAITFQSKLVIMDEPTSSLTRVEIEKLYKIIANLKSNGVAVLFISHKLDEIFTVSDEITVLRDGQYIATKETEDFTEQELVRLMVGRDVQYLSLLGESTGDNIFTVQSLGKSGYFKDISFDLARGEILGITGLVGSGRTELAKAIFGIHDWDEGQITLLGKNLSLSDSKDAIEAGIAYVPEDRHLEGLVLEEEVYKNMNVPIMNDLVNRMGLLDKVSMISNAKAQICDLDIRPTNPMMQASQLSGGNQQKVVLGKWILSNPKLLIVDEPTNGVDIGAKIEIHKLLRRLANNGMGIIVISSELPEVLALSDRIMVMAKGRNKGILKNQNLSQTDVMNVALDAKPIGQGRGA